jgi:regulator of sigma E protease
MQNLHEVVVAAVAFIVLVGVMVVVHEFGHFAVAKLCRVRVEAFSFGFGPRLFGIKYGDTDYKVCLLPLGGFVKMTGEAPEQNLEASGTQAEVLPDDPGSFLNHPRWQRVLIGLAGPAANFVLAFVLMVFYFGWINEVPSFEVKTTSVEWVVPGSAAAQAGLEPGDIIRHFDSVDNPTWDQVNQRAALNQNQTVPVTVDRGGKTIGLFFHVPAPSKGEDFDVSDAGAIPQFVPGPIGVLQVQPGMPAAQAGLRDGDSIQSVDGHAFHTVQALLAYLQAGQGKPVSLQVVRNGATLPPLMVHPARIDTGWKLGFAPVPIPFRHDPRSFVEAVTKSKVFCADNSTLIVEVLGRLFTRKVSVSQLQGPVGIARMAGEAAEMKGWLPKFGLAAAISLNLGILNLLPFPILDGGGVLLLLIESGIRRDIGVNVKERIYQAAFVVLMAFFAFIIFNDVTRLPIFAHFKP